VSGCPSLLPDVRSVGQLVSRTIGRSRFSWEMATTTTSYRKESVPGRRALIALYAWNEPAQFPCNDRICMYCPTRPWLSGDDLKKGLSSACASLNEPPPRTTTIGPQFSGDLFSSHHKEQRPGYGGLSTRSGFKGP